jgi:polyhydroxyalkanoate synthesis regulator phasin
VSYNGDGFGAYSYNGLRELVKERLDEEVKAGKMTQKEADKKLAELLEKAVKSADTCYFYTTPAGNGELVEFSAETYEELYELVKNHFDEQVEKGNMTQEEADKKLAKISDSNMVKVLD